MAIFKAHMVGREWGFVVRRLTIKGWQYAHPFAHGAGWLSHRFGRGMIVDRDVAEEMLSELNTKKPAPN